MKRALATIIILLFTSALYADISVNDSRPKSVDRDVTNFFAQLTKGNSDVAVADLFDQSPIGEKDGATKNLSSQLKFIQEVYGKVESVEELDFRRKGKNLIQLRYLVFFQEFPIRVMFTFFRSPINDKWILSHFHFDDQFHLLFD